MPGNTLPVAVLGAGIVGVCTAACLQREGHRVVLIARGNLTDAASYGNAGCLNGSSIVPVAMPGVLSKVPYWLLRPDGPLVLRWHHLPHMLPWLARFIASSRPDKVAAQARALRALVGGSLDDYAPLVRAAQLEHLLHRRGHLSVYTSATSYAADATAMALRAGNGVTVEEIGAQDLHAREPDLAPEFIRGRFIAETGHVADPGAFVTGLARHVAAQGAQVLKTGIRGIQTNGAQVSAVVTDDGVQPVKAIVVALGAWSAFIAKQLGDRVLLDTERGYHIEVPRARVGPRIPTLWSEAKMFVTPMQERVRCTGTVELAGLDAAPDWGRTRLLERQLRHMYPAIGGDMDAGAAASLPRWLGFRPSTPDSLPVIGPSARFGNAMYAFGHGHIGLTAGAPTGRLVAQLISGKKPAIDLTPFSVRRFL